MTDKIVDVDLLKVYQKEGKKKVVITVLAWGDPIRVGETKGDQIAVSVRTRIKQKDGFLKSADIDGFVDKDAKFRDPGASDIMRFTVVDVGQGDAAVLETPRHKLLIVDGGVDRLFARYLAARFPDTTDKQRREVDAIVVTHGDADHFAGLAEIYKSEVNPSKNKQIFIHPARVFHNGLVVRGSKEDPLTAFGSTSDFNGETYVTDLVNDITDLSPTKLTGQTKAWATALKSWSKYGPVEIERLSDKATGNPFAFLEEEGMKVEIDGPVEATVNGKPALPLLHSPLKVLPESQGQEVGTNVRLSKEYSASHTINGHSVVLRLTYGNIHLLLPGDLNAEAENALAVRAQGGSINLESEFFKVPHHGSADLATAFLRQVKPVVSVVSSGDENEKQEYIHPRAPLVGALGQYSRVSQPLIFVTEMIAFFKSRGKAKVLDKNEEAKGAAFYSYEKTSYGVLHLAFDKKRMLVFTHSGKRDLKEAYAFTVTDAGQVTFDAVKSV